MKYTNIMQSLGLALNESKILETLFTHGSLNISRISDFSGINRRNIYDSLSRLSEKGLVTVILGDRENIYKAEAPDKLMDILTEKQELLETILPELTDLYHDVPPKTATRVYRGEEGWKIFMREVINAKKDVYLLGAKGALASESLQVSFKKFLANTKKVGIEFRVLYDWQVSQSKDIIGHLGKNYKILPKEYSNSAAIAIFGPHVAIFRAAPISDKLNKQYTFITITDKNTAEAFRLWFQFMWQSIPQ